MSAYLSNTLNSTAMPVAQLAELLRRSSNRLPTSADGLTDAEAAPNVEQKQDKEAFLMRMVKGLSGQIRRGNPLPPAALPSIIDAIRHARIEGLDDRKLILEHVLALMSRLPPAVPNSREWSLQNEIQNHVIQLFYDALPHPPTTFVPSMMLEMKIPTVVGDARLGAGGSVGVSEGNIGKVGVPTANQPSTGGNPAALATPGPATPALQGQTPTPAPSRFAGDNGWGSTSPAGISTVNPTATTGVAPWSQPNGDAKPSEAIKPATIPQKAYNTAFRVPSGAGNNPHMPLLGAAGTPYARNVVPLHAFPQSALPDPGMVFDLLMRRQPPPPAADMASGAKYDPKIAAEFKGQGHGQKHPSGLSSLLFAFGDLIIHSLFRTLTPGRGGKKDQGINLTSSYLDLSVLYGVDENEMAGVRRNDGTGRLWEDTWADPRITMMGPAVGALLVIFCRNHNYVALRLLEINERGTYKQPCKIPPRKNKVTAKELFPKLSAAEIETQDHDIFNRARLINCAYFMNAILGDYLSGILGTFRDANDWYLNPLEEIRQGGVTKVNRAEGNQVSAEFNLLYRWHSVLTPKDTLWLEEAFRKNLSKDNAVHKMSPGNVELQPKDFLEAVTAIRGQQGDHPIAWTFGELTRTDDGGFRDHELAKILHSATDTVACAYGARGIPSVMKVVEMMGIEQGRNWGLCTMNEFRQFVGLKKYESFKEWNPTGDIAETAEMLYGHIDNLELYVGLMCEESKQAGPGAGLCPGYTISRAILADAVCLTRGDRFFTTDLTPTNLTSWGYQDCSRDVKNGSMGGNVCKLLFRNLPDYYPDRSVYAHFPFVTPEEMRIHLGNMQLADQYSFDPLPSEPIRPVISVNTAAGVSQVLKDMKTFNTTYSEALRILTKGNSFFIAFDDNPRHRIARNMMSKAIYRDGAMERYADFYRSTSRTLIERRSFSSGPKKRVVNIVRDVLNIVPVHWACEEIAGIPLKSENAPRGIFTEQQTYGMLAAMFAFIFLNLEPQNEWPLRENAVKSSTALYEFIKGRVQKVSGEGSFFSLRGIRDSILHYLTDEVDNSDPFYRALIANNESGLSTEELAYNVLGLITGSTASFAMASSIVVDFYLNTDRAKEKADIMALAMDNTPKAAARLTGYAREALRLHPQAPGIFRQAAVDATITEGTGEQIKVNKGDRIFVSLGRANMDPDTFSNPEAVDPTRAKEKYSSFGHGEHSFLGELFTDTMIPAVMRSVFSLKKVRRGPGSTGILKKFTHDIHGTATDLYISNKGTVSPFPASILIEYDV